MVVNGQKSGLDQDGYSTPWWLRWAGTLRYAITLKCPGGADGDQYDYPYLLIAGAQYFVSASDAEGFPNALAEAMALGKPVVATDCPSGPSKLLEGSASPGTGVCEAQHGLLVLVDNQAALAAAMR